MNNFIKNLKSFSNGSNQIPNTNKILNSIIFTTNASPLKYNYSYNDAQMISTTIVSILF